MQSRGGGAGLRQETARIGRTWGTASSRGGPAGDQPAELPPEHEGRPMPRRPPAQRSAGVQAPDGAPCLPDLGRAGDVLEGKAGEAVKEKNWIEAEKQIEAEVKARAYEIWEQQGRPTGPEGDAVREKNLHAAEVQLLKETEEEFRRRPIP